jgi:hypothetical protein
MTTLQAIDTVASWKLGGIYTDESAANTQQKILSLLNTARAKVLRDIYVATRTIPQVAYQEFDIVPSWEDEECVSFVAKVPMIMTFPAPQLNGWDAVLPKCDCAYGLTEIKSEQQLRAYRSHPHMKSFRTAGWYIVTNTFMKGILAPKVKADGLLGRAVISNPEDVINFNIAMDEYPLPEDMFSEVKKVLEGDDGKRWFRIVPDQISNTKVDADATSTASGR